MAKKLGIGDDELEDWWDCTRKPTHEYIKAHRNNTISGLRKLFQGEKNKIWLLTLHSCLSTNATSYTQTKLYNKAQAILTYY